MPHGGSNPGRTSFRAACASAWRLPLPCSTGPTLIICDEPTTALDVSIQAQILTEMKTLARDLGTAMIWISHDLATVSSVALRILVMYAGRIIENGPMAVCCAQPRHPYTGGLLATPCPRIAVPGQDLVQIPGAMPSLIDLPPGCAFQPRCLVCRSGLCGAMPALTADGRARCALPLPSQRRR